MLGNKEKMEISHSEEEKIKKLHFIYITDYYRSVKTSSNYVHLHEQISKTNTNCKGTLQMIIFKVK